MSWLAVVLEAGAGEAERLSDALLEAGALAIDIGDAAAGTPLERPLFDEPDLASLDPWRRTRLVALFEARPHPVAAVTQALRAAGLPSTTPYRTAPVDERDWVRASQDQFLPVRISSRLWIVPTWHRPPDPHALNIILDPGIAFGTGAHPTTRLCLRWLEANVRGGETVIDFGCGSGILGIAALKLGAARARAIDIDERSLVAARGNALQNRVEGRFLAAADAGRDRAHIVVANILANPLKVLAPLLAELTLEGGRIALSGILAAQADELRAVYSERFVMDAENHEDGWTMLGGVRRSR